MAKPALEHSTVKCCLGKLLPRGALRKGLQLLPLELQTIVVRLPILRTTALWIHYVEILMRALSLSRNGGIIRSRVSLRVGEVVKRDVPIQR
uniref:Uncharacterized protein n=1 Tax=viral metagenome TaxID=1070528 RepID=A0A6C0C1S5_9ZZZZ